LRTLQRVNRLETRRFLGCPSIQYARTRIRQYAL